MCGALRHRLEELPEQPAAQGDDRQIDASRDRRQPAGFGRERLIGQENAQEQPENIQLQGPQQEAQHGTPDSPACRLLAHVGWRLSGLLGQEFRRSTGGKCRPRTRFWETDRLASTDVL